jgi:hypothetical protein
VITVAERAERTVRTLGTPGRTDAPADRRQDGPPTATAAVELQHGSPGRVEADEGPWSGWRSTEAL